MSFVKKCLIISVVCLLGVLSHGQDAQQDVIRFSGQGKDAEAIEVYEQQLAGKDVPVEVLRAVAGSYWRLSQFDTARELYRKVMQKQPSLSTLPGVSAEEGASEEAESPQEEKGGPQTGDAMTAANTEAVQTEQSSEKRAPAAALKNEIESLRSAYTTLEEERERQRQTVESRILELVERTEESLRVMDALQEELQAAQQGKAAAEAATAEASETFAEQRQTLENEIAQLEVAKAEIESAKQASEQQATDLVASLESTLASVRAAKKQAEEDAVAKTTALQKLQETYAAEKARLSEQLAEREQELQGQIAKLSAREAELSSELGRTRSELQSELTEANAKLTALEERRGDLAYQLESERIAARTRRTEYLEAEERLQNALSNQKAQVITLQKERDAAVAAAAADAATLNEMDQKFAAERVAYAQSLQEAEDAKAALEQRLKEEEERVDALESELRILMKQAEALESETHARFAELEQSRDTSIAELKQAQEQVQELQQAMSDRESAWLAEQKRLQEEQQALEQVLVDEREKFEIQRQQMVSAEGALREKMRAMETRNQSEQDAAVEKIKLLEQELADRESQVANLLEQLSRSTLQKSLDEITRMEADFATLNKQRNDEQVLLQERIAQLEVSVAEGKSVQSELASELQREREQRQKLERKASNLQEQADARQKELEQAQRMLAEATKALNLQYDSLRKQLDSSGVAVRVTEPGEDDGADGLLPVIGRLGAATESATMEVTQLRNQFEEERAALTQALTKAQVEREQLSASLEKLKEAHAQERTRLANEYESSVSDLQASHGQAQERWQNDIARMERALAGAQAIANGLQRDLDDAQSAQRAVLRIARDSADTLNQRMKALTAAKEALAAKNSNVVGDATGDEVAVTNDVAAVAEGDTVAAFLADVQMAMDTDKPQLAIQRYEERKKQDDAVIPAESLMMIGNAYRAQEKYEEAYQLYSELLEREPESLHAEQKIVMTLFDMGEYDRALDRLAQYERTASDVVEDKQ